MGAPDLPDEARLLSAFVLPLAAVLVATPVAIRVAKRVDFHDHPIGYKGHASPTPYLGGAAVLMGFLLGAASVGGGLSRLAPIVIGAFVLWVIGTLDDRRTLGLGLRVCVEIAAATILALSGLGWEIFGDPAADFALTVFWIVGLVNAFNLMDNMDGATSTVAALSSLGVAVLALVLGDAALAALAFALCGACLGFLPYNLARPARIFLGDGGSMPIGFVVAATIMALPLGEDVAWQRLLAAVLLAGLPILDTLLVVVSRRRAGVSALLGGRDHLTHRLRRRAPSARAVALVLASAQAALCAAALAVTQLGDFSIVFSWGLLMVAAAVAVTALESRTWAPVRTTWASQGPLLDIPRADHVEQEPVLVAAEATASTAAALVRHVTGDSGAAMSDAGTVDQGVPTVRQAEGGDRAPQPPPTVPGAALPRPPDVLELVLIASIALACGLSPVLSGFYNLSVWGPIALLLLAVLFALVIARPAVPRRGGLLAIASLVALWAWSLLSTGWAESADQALVEANRWMLYAALLAILLLLLRDDRLAKFLLACTTVLVLGLGCYLVGVMLLGDGAGLFLEGRLNEPLGYINGQAGYFLLGFWPLIAVAERTGKPWLAGAAVGGAVLLAGLVLLTQTRAVVPAFVVAAVVLLALVPGRLRRAWVLVAVSAGVALLVGPILDVLNQTPPDSQPPGDTVRDVALKMLLVSGLVGSVWALAVAAGAAATGRSERLGVTLRNVSFAVLGTAALAGFVAVAVAADDPIQRIGDQYRGFTQLGTDSEGGSRFTSGGGNRYDYWRIAVNQFRSEPVRGVGAGNYDRTYFLERRTSEDIDQPHSLPLQALAELGLVGGLALAGFIGVVLYGLGRRAWAAHRNPSGTDAGLAVAGGGIFLAWLVHTSIDWLHLIPGLTGVALCGAAVLLGPWSHRATPGRHGYLRRWVPALCALLVVVAAVQLGRSTLADYHQQQGREALTGDPRRALEEAKEALRLNDESVPTYYLAAAALATMDDYEAARETLLEAARREPHDFVTWTLLGDLAVRRGDIEQAREDYGQAARLNPRDAALKLLAADPRSALGLGPPAAIVP